jgi:hypothetical protein
MLGWIIINYYKLIILYKNYNVNNMVHLHIEWQAVFYKPRGKCCNKVTSMAVLLFVLVKKKMEKDSKFITWLAVPETQSYVDLTCNAIVPTQHYGMRNIWGRRRKKLGMMAAAPP